MAPCAYDGADDGTGLKPPEENVRREDGVGVTLVFSVWGM